MRLTALLLAALSGQASAAARVVAIDDFRVKIEADGSSSSYGLSISTAANPAHDLWSSAAGGEWLTVGVSYLGIASYSGSFNLHAALLVGCHPSGAPELASEATVTLTWPLGGSPLCWGKHATMTLHQIDQHRLAFQLSSDEPAFNTVHLAAQSWFWESFYGFGLQPTYLDLKGQVVPIWTQEQGITRGREPYSSLINLASPGAAGTPVTSYMTAPFYLTNQGHALFLYNTEYSEFDLCRADQAQIRLQAPTMAGEWIAAATPLEAVSVYTGYAGRMKALPDWVHRGAIVGMQGGTAAVRKVWQRLQALQTPLAGFWLQDWVGKRTTALGSQLWWNWERDDERYPEWPQLVQDLRLAGVRVLGYINPHLVDVAAAGKDRFQRNLHAEAVQGGYIVKNSEGAPHRVQIGAFDTALIDPTNATARLWFKRIIQQNLLGSGLSGWMADFGESFPDDGVVAAGIDGRRFHNRYAEEWAKLNREAVQDAGVDDDTVFFCRAGYTRSPTYARLFWQGDQMVSWDQNDGLASAVTGLIGGGLAGYSLNHSDIGGYTTIVAGPFGIVRSAELLSRWEEFSAFTPIFRSHEGNQPDANAQIYSSEASYRSFDRNARLYASWFFYRRELMHEAEALGYPLVRALFLHYPDDERAYRTGDEYLLGRDLLVAPVLAPGQTERTVYLPRGAWVHLWSGVLYRDEETGREVQVAAPLGQPPVFYRLGSATGAAWIKELRRFGIAVPESRER